MMVILLLLCFFTLATCENCLIPPLDVVTQGGTCRTSSTDVTDGQHALTQCGIWLFCNSGKVSACRSQTDQSCLSIDQECSALVQETSSSSLACTTKRKQRDLHQQERARRSPMSVSARLVDLIYRRKRSEDITTSTEEPFHFDFTTVPPTTSTTATTPPVTTTSTIAAADPDTTTTEYVANTEYTTVPPTTTTTITTPPAANPDTTTTEDVAIVEFTTVPPTTTTTSPTLVRKRRGLNDKWKREEVGRSFTAALEKRRKEEDDEK